MLSAKESPEFRFAVGHHFAHTLRVRRKKFSITKQRERVSGLTSGLKRRKLVRNAYIRSWRVPRIWRRLKPTDCATLLERWRRNDRWKAYLVMTRSKDLAPSLSGQPYDSPPKLGEMVWITSSWRCRRRALPLVQTGEGTGTRKEIGE